MWATKQKDFEQRNGRAALHTEKMRLTSSPAFGSLLALSALLVISAPTVTGCSDTGSSTPGSGGSSGSQAGAATGGGTATEGGTATGGATTSGGANAQGGSGASSGGSSDGGAGGASSGGEAAGGAAAGGAATGGDAGAGGSDGSAKILGGYWPNWTKAPVRISDIHPSYNLIYLFHAQPVGGPPGTTGAVYWSSPGDDRGAATNLVADIAYARSMQGRKIILTVGGAGAGMSFPQRSKSQAFVDSVVAIYDDLGGVDGLDWNTFEADQEPDTEEMIWISQTLKARYPGFLITSPPAPWRQRDKDFCVAMVQASAIDYCAPQYYDGPGLDDPDYVVNSVDEWVSLLGPTHVAVGFGVADATNYMTIQEVVQVWNQIRSNHPTIRGAFDWQIHTDEADGWAFGSTLGPLMGD